MKKILLPQLFIPIMLVLMLVYSISGNAQCTITGSVNASELSCGVVPLSACNGVVIIGDGIISTSISMNAPLDLSCLGAIQLIVKNGASLDFSSGNDRLTLAAGSGIIFEEGSDLTGSNCNASERIYIGTTILASCNGGAGALYTFAQLLSQGGYNLINVLSKTDVCGVGTATINVSMLPEPTSEVTYNLYSASTGGAPLSTMTSSTNPYTASFTTPSISSTTSFYVEATKGSLTTPRKEVVITVNSVPTALTIAGLSSVCANSTGKVYSVTNTLGSAYSWTIPTGGSVTAGAGTGSITVSFGTMSGNVSVTETNSSGCVGPQVSQSVAVNALPTTSVISGLSSVCANSSGNVYSVTNTAGSSYSWTIPTGGSVTAGAGTSSITVSFGTTSGNVSVTETNSSGCVGSQVSMSIVVNALPIASLTSSDTDNTFCTSTSVTFTASGGTNYNFRVAGSSVQNSSTTTYTTTTLINSQVVDVLVTNAVGCIAISSGITNVVNALPIITTQPTNQLDCEGSSVKFKAIATGSGVLSFIWERKLPAESIFTAANSDPNVTYPNTPTLDEVRIANVGSSKSLNGTLYQVKITDGNSCSIISNAVALSVNEIIGVSGGTNVTQCFNTNYSYTVSVSSTSLPNVVSYQWKKSVTTGVWTIVTDGGAYFGADTATLSITGGAPSESGEYRVYVTFKNSTTTCSVDSSTRTRKITFLSQLAAPMATITPPNCSTSTGTLTVTGVSAGNTFSFDGGVFFQSSNIKSGLGLGNYVIVVKNSLGCVSLPATYSVDMSAAVWNGSSWSKLPTSDDIILFDGDYSSTDTDYSSGYLSGCSCQVKSGNVVINSAHTLSLQNAIVVIPGATFTLENNASLIQVNSVSNSGSVIVKRYSTPMTMYDYTYWSSPTTGTQTLSGFAPKSNPKFLLTYDNGWRFVSPSSVFSKGIGYAILAPEPYIYTVPMVFTDSQFVGVPNNGDIGVPVTYLSSLSTKLVGNPYPSAMDADKFIAANSTTTTGTLYFWTHNHTKTNAGYSDDYAVYNTTGGTAVSSGHGNINVPTKWIASGQGFVVGVKASGNIVFNNSMRIGGSANNNTNFYRSSSIVNSDKVLEKHRIWLNLVNDTNSFSQTLVGYVESATNGCDFGFDGLRIGENELELYSLIDKNPYIIQARALPFSNNDEVLLGYKTIKSGNFKIAIDNMDGLFSNIAEVIIEDKLLGVSQNIKDKPYSFSTDSGVFNNRFVLKYGSTTVDLNDLQANSNQILILSNDHKIYIKSELDSINQVFVFDMLGRQIFENKRINSNTVLINNLAEQQVLVVKAVLDNGQTITKKIIN